MEQFLIQQSRFNERLALVEERSELSQLNRQRLRARSSESTCTHFQSSKAPGIDKAKFASGSELGDQMCMLLNFRFGRGDDHASGHAEMHDPLASFAAFRFQVKN